MLYVANMIVFNILFFCCNIYYKLYLKKGFIIIMILVFLAQYYCLINSLYRW